MPSQLSAASLSAFLAGASLVHFLRPQTFDGIVPSAVPGSARQVVYVSGLAELACAALVGVRRTRHLGGFAAAALFVAVFPANVKMALDGGVPGVNGVMASKAFAYGRLPVQIPLVAWALNVGRNS